MREAGWTGPSTIVDAGPGQKGASTLTGLNPVDRGKESSKPHVLPAAKGTPSAVAVSGASTTTA
ncbi:hypothetical protein [Streptomyces nigra]|uniref:hypothetical protein n=1 Tax=Streptomyces nigra TaxID=1827580 RepID=UPI00364BA67D